MRPRRPRRDTPDAAPADLFGLPAGPDYHHEARAKGLACGVDEAGRGPLAGPVVTAAVVLDPSAIPPGLDDSKKLDAETRARLFDLICASAHVAVASASAREIDRTNIRAATLAAMARAVAALPVRPALALIDGRDVPPGLSIPGRALVKGDQLSVSIAAASIIAKVVRDRMMIAADAAWPGYGFADHKGYGTARHLDAIARLGPCPLHRMSFAPLQAGGENTGAVNVSLSGGVPLSPEDL
jgi:ribonuclease HII